MEHICIIIATFTVHYHNGHREEACNRVPAIGGSTGVGHECGSRAQRGAGPIPSRGYGLGR